jgi:hypothetical protein
MFSHQICVLSELEGAFLPKVAEASRQELPVKEARNECGNADKTLGGLGFPPQAPSSFDHVVFLWPVRSLSLLYH